MSTEGHRVSRLTFAHAHIGKPTRFWHRFIWDDEKIFFVQRQTKRAWCRRSTSEPNVRYASYPKVKHSPKLCVWACMSSRGVGHMHIFRGTLTAHRYTTILKRNLVQSATELYGKNNTTWRFLSDNDPKHAAKLTKAWLDEAGFRKDQHPAGSPGPEPFGKLVECGRGEHYHAPHQPCCTGKAIRRSWNSITPEACRTLVDSMPKRCQAVIDAQGYPTKY